MPYEHVPSDPDRIIRSFLVYLKDLVSEKESSLFLVGTDEEMQETVKTLSEGIITGKLERPLNVKDLARQLDAEVARGEAAEAKKKILIIDDDPTMLRMIKNLLSKEYHVYMVNSGMNGITFLANNKVDDVSIKKLTKNNPTMQKKFEELKNTSSE